MAEILDDVSYLSREIGPRPAGTEEEQQSALYIADQVHKRTGFHAEIEDIKCMANADLVRLIYLAVSFACLLLAFLLPTTSIVTALISLLCAVFFTMELWAKRPFLSRFLTRDISQNVVVKYAPSSERTRAGSPRKIVVVANYDSGRVRREVRSGLVKLYSAFSLAASISVVASPFLIVLRNIVLAGNPGIAGAVLSLVYVVALVLLALALLVVALRRFSAYNEGANNNASSIAAMLEVLRRIDGTAAPVGAPHARAPHEHESGQRKTVVHGKEAAYAAGVVPEGARLSYDDGLDSNETHHESDAALSPENLSVAENGTGRMPVQNAGAAQQPAIPADSPRPQTQEGAMSGGSGQGEDSAAARLRSAKAAIAALTGEAVSDDIYLDLDTMPAPAPFAREGAGNMADAPLTSADAQGANGAAGGDGLPAASAPATAGLAAHENAPAVSSPSQADAVVSLDEPAPAAPAYEAPRPSAEPAWFTAARAKANRKAEVPAKRSRFADALDAAVKDPAALAQEETTHVDEETEECLRQLRESFGAPAASTTASFAPLGRQGETAAFDVDFDMALEKPSSVEASMAGEQDIAEGNAQMPAASEAAPQAEQGAQEAQAARQAQAAQEALEPSQDAAQPSMPRSASTAVDADALAEGAIAEGHEPAGPDEPPMKSGESANAATEQLPPELASDDERDGQDTDAAADYDILDAELVEIIDGGEYAEDEFAAYDEEDENANQAAAYHEGFADEEADVDVEETESGNSGVANRIGGLFSSIRETVMPSGAVGREGVSAARDDDGLAPDDMQEEPFAHGREENFSSDEALQDGQASDYEEEYDYEEEPSRIADLRERVSGAFSRLKGKLSPTPNYEEDDYYYDDYPSDGQGDAGAAYGEGIAAASEAVSAVLPKNGETGEMPPVVPSAAQEPASPGFGYRQAQDSPAASREGGRGGALHARKEQTMFIEEPMEVEEPDDSLINQAASESSATAIAGEDIASEGGQDGAGAYEDDGAVNDADAPYGDESYEYDEYGYPDDADEPAYGGDLKQRLVGFWSRLKKRAYGEQDEYDDSDFYYEDESGEEGPQKRTQDAAASAQPAYQTAYGPSHSPVTSINVNYRSPEPVNGEETESAHREESFLKPDQAMFEDPALVEDPTNQQLAFVNPANEDSEPPIAVAPLPEHTPASPANPRIVRAGRYESTVSSWEDSPAGEQAAFAATEAAMPVDDDPNGTTALPRASSEDPNKTSAMAPIDVSALMNAGAAKPEGDRGEAAGMMADASWQPAPLSNLPRIAADGGDAGAPDGSDASSVDTPQTRVQPDAKAKPHLSVMIPRIDMDNAKSQTNLDNGFAVEDFAPADAKAPTLASPAPAAVEGVSRTARLRRLRTSLPSMSGTITNEPMAALADIESDVEKTGPFNPVHTTGAIGAATMQYADANQAPSQAPRDEQDGDAVDAERLDAPLIEAPVEAVFGADDWYGDAENATEAESDWNHEQLATPEHHRHRRLRRWHAHKEEVSTPQEWLGVSDDFDARAVGKARGDWSSFRPDDERAGVGDRNASQSTMGWRADKMNPDPANDYDTGIDSAFNDEEEDFLDEDTGLNNGRWMGGAYSGRREVQRDRYQFDDDLADYAGYADGNYRGDLPREDDYDSYLDDESYLSGSAGSSDGAMSRFRYRSPRGESEEWDGRRSERRTSRGRDSFSEDDAWNIAAARAAERSAVADALADPLVQEELGETYGFVDDPIMNEVWFVALGAGLSDNGGMEAFLDDHADELRGAIVINLEGIGGGDLAGMASEGLLRRFKTTTRMKRFLRNAGQATGIRVGQARMNWRDSAATVAMRRGMPAITIAGIDGDVPAHFASADDVIENLDEATLKQRVNFILELLRAI